MKFSVIVPVYRTGQYLEQCVRSVLAQSCRDLEMILVDDCSPDNCGSLCDEYASQDPRIRVIHKPENEGLGLARNTGLAAAQGDYILFLDSDDWICPDLLTTCAPFLNTDILIFGTTFVHEGQRKNSKRLEPRIPAAMTAKTPAEKADAFAMLTQQRIFQFAWNKLYRRAFLLESGILFEETKLIEDFLFNIALFPLAETVHCIAHPLHFYRKPAHETLASRYSPEFFDLCKRKYQLEKDFLKNADGEVHMQLIYHGFVKHLLSAVLRNGSAAANLSRLAQKKALHNMLCDPVTETVIANYQPQSPVYRLLARWIRRKQSRVLFLACRLLHLLHR